MINDLMKPKTRTKKVWEIYAKNHYATRVKGSVPAGSSIITVRQSIQEALKNEPQELIDELKLEQARQRALLRKDSDDSDNVDVEVDPLLIRRLVC